jgi:hypothetical protein
MERLMIISYVILGTAKALKEFPDEEFLILIQQLKSSLGGTLLKMDR